jgi:hypothetical protein
MLTTKYTHIPTYSLWLCYLKRLLRRCKKWKQSLITQTECKNTDYMHSVVSDFYRNIAGNRWDFRFSRQRVWRLLSSVLLQCVVWKKFTDVSEAASTSEMSENFYQTSRRRYNTEDSHLHTRRRENLKSFNGQTWHTYLYFHIQRRGREKK